MKFKRVFNLQRVMLDKKTMFRYCLPETGGPKLKSSSECWIWARIYGNSPKSRAHFWGFKDNEVGGGAAIWNCLENTKNYDYFFYQSSLSPKRTPSEKL